MAAKAKTATSKKSVEKKTKTAPSKSGVKARMSSLTGKQKVLLFVIVVAIAFFIIVGKQLFVAATVNGFPISRLEIVRELEKQGGQQVLDSIVNERLILQEARKAGVEVTEEDLNLKIEELREQMTAQGQELDSLLEAQGMSMDDLREQIKIQVYLEKLLTDRVEVTDDQISQYLEENAAFLPEEASDEEKNELAREQLTQQLLSTEFSTWLTEVKANADINYFVEY